MDERLAELCQDVVHEPAAEDDADHAEDDRSDRHARSHALPQDVAERQPKSA
jgi:hypothetical protein